MSTKVNLVPDENGNDPFVQLSGSNVPLAQKIPVQITDGTSPVVVAWAGDGLADRIGMSVNSNLENYNGSTYDRVRNNTQGTLLASAARTATTNSVAQTNYNARGIIVNLDVSVGSGTGGLTVQIKAISQNSPSNGDLLLHANPTAVTAAGRFTYVLYPGATMAGGQVQNAWATVLPRLFYVVVSHGDATSYTYSLTYSLIV